MPGGRISKEGKYFNATLHQPLACYAFHKTKRAYKKFTNADNQTTEQDPRYHYKRMHKKYLHTSLGYTKYLRKLTATPQPPTTSNKAAFKTVLHILSTIKDSVLHQ